MRDGLYQVDYGSICAGFVIEGGRLAACAPILERRFAYWFLKARWVPPYKPPEPEQFDLFEKGNEMEIQKTILAFDGKYEFLSNFYPCSVYSYASVEHAYQAMKTRDPIERATIKNAPSAAAAKRFGRSVANRRVDWEEIKERVMLECLRYKFADPILATRLKLTGNARLEEGNYWHDTYWGICPAGSGNGKNRLGELLMQVRTELLSEGK